MFCIFTPKNREMIQFDYCNIFQLIELQPSTSGSRTMELTHVEKKKTCLHMVDVDVTIVFFESFC